MGFNRFYDRITLLQRYQARISLGHSCGYVCRILPGLFPTNNIPILVNE